MKKYKIAAIQETKQEAEKKRKMKSMCMSYINQANLYKQKN